MHTLETTLTIFGTGMVSGIGLSVWTCHKINRFRSPGYYRRRARRVSREWGR
jgi:hypothetical protein